MFYFYLFVIGAAMGSFLNVLIDRLPKDKSILGRSHCDYCKKTLEIRDLFPVVSFIVLRGRCRFCKKKLSFFYPFVEILTGAAFVLVWKYAAPPQAFYLILISIFIAIFFADIKYQIIPDELQIAAFATVVLILFFRGLSPIEIGKRSIDGLFVMFPILLIYLTTRGRAMGFGDVKFAFVMGVLLGSLQGFLALYIAFITGAVAGVFLIFFGKKRMKSKIAFGPFLVTGTVFLIFFQTEVFSYIAVFLPFVK